MSKYDHLEIEPKWRRKWEESELYKTKDDISKPKYYILDMFPYPSGEGLHVGHPKGYIATDIFARKKMLSGYSVLHPMGWDAFGLPAENYALKNKVHPRIATEKNIATFKLQLEKLGLTYDWSREVNTIDPSFYKWTQWAFIKMFEKGIAFESFEPIIWCPSCKTGLANEDLEDGKCERCGSEIERKPMRQWVLKITDYADRMLEDLDKLPEWEESIKEMQKNWIGRSEGAKVKFQITISKSQIESNINVAAESLGEDSATAETANAGGVKVGFKTHLNSTEEKRTIWFLTFPTIKRRPIFETKEEVKAIMKYIYESCLKNNYNLHEASIMLDHVHLVIDTDEKIAIDKIFKNIKGYSAKYFIDIFDLYEENDKGRHLWTPKGNYSIIKDKDRYDSIIEYIKKNPEKDDLEREDRIFSESGYLKSGNTAGVKVDFKTNLNTDYSHDVKVGINTHLNINGAKEISGDCLEVFTTRPDTLFGATYMVVAPEHALISNYKSQITNFKEVEEYVNKAKNKSEMERTDLNKEKTGVKLEGVVAINPVNNEELPIFVADYVLIGYGTGAIMAVPAHDERDWEFAKKYGLPIRPVVAECYSAHKGIENVQIREDKPTEKRENVVCIVKHWQEDKYIMLDWKNQGWHSFIVGGIEEGETLEKAAGRELEEETGYKNYKIIKQLGEEIHANFFAMHKGVNRYGIFKAVYIELQDGKREEIDKEERLKHEIVWADEAMLKEKIVFKNHINFWNRLKEGDLANCDEGVSINSDFLNGLKTSEAKEKIIAWLEEKGIGKKAVTYKLKDWVFSRQRYWGEPIPIVHCEKCGNVAVPEKELPLKLPEVENYEPSGTGESPLATITDWVNTTCPNCGGPAKRETNTMPQWAGSSWYYLRFIDPKNENALVDKDKEKYWSPVDFYVGGAEHATRHLIYARFWHKFLFDIGAVSYDEPFTRLQHVGLIMAEDGRKMSKRWGNVINPDEVVEKYGADAMRVYEMFMGPFSQPCAWSTNGLVGTRKFLDRIYQLQEKAAAVETDKETLNILHKTIKKVGEDIDGFKFNTAISQMMILLNRMSEAESFTKDDYEKFLIILSPFAPHLAEEIYSALGHSESIFKQTWPAFDLELAHDEKINLVVQINGKVRTSIEVDAEINEEAAKALVLENEIAKKWIEGKEIVKVVFVKGKLVNIVTRDI